MQLGAFDDLQLPCAGPGDDGGHLRASIAAIGKDAFDERELTAGSAQEIGGAVAILHAGGMDRDVQEETLRIDKDVAFAAGDLLARIEALRIDRRPPFYAALALWLLMTTADGLALRPSFSRTAT